MYLAPCTHEDITCRKCGVRGVCMTGSRMHAGPQGSMLVCEESVAQREVSQSKSGGCGCSHAPLQAHRGSEPSHTGHSLCHHLQPCTGLLSCQGAVCAAASCSNLGSTAYSPVGLLTRMVHDPCAQASLCPDLQPCTGLLSCQGALYTADSLLGSSQQAFKLHDLISMACKRSLAAVTIAVALHTGAAPLRCPA